METSGTPPKRGNFWLGIIISVICLAAIFFFIDPAEILKALQNTNYTYLLLSGTGIIAFLAMRAVRWRFLLGNQLPYQSIFHIQNIGYMLNNFLPARLGDVARSVLVGSIPPITIATGLSSTVVDRLTDMVFVVIVLPFSLISIETLPDWMRSGAQVTGFVAIVGMIVLIVAANQQALVMRVATAVLDRIPFLDTTAWLHRVEDLLKGLTVLASFKTSLLLIVYTILVWVPVIFSYYIALRAVGLDVTWAMAAFVFVAAAFSVALPSSPGQIGVYHAGVIAALTLLNQSEANSASFAFIFHAFNMIILPTLLGLIGLAATGSTLQNVINTTRTYLQRNEKSKTPN